MANMRGDAARGMRRCARRSAASTTRPARSPRPTSWRRSRLRRRATAASTTRMCATPLGDRYLDPFREAIEIGRRGGGPVHITHFYHRQTYPGGPEPLLALVDDARAEGLDVTFDMYPYEWAITRLLIQMPLWIQEGGPEPLQGTARRSRRRASGCAPRSRDRGAAYPSPARGRTCGWGYSSARRPRWEGRHARGRHGRAGHRRGRHDVRPAAARGPARQPGHAGTVDETACTVRRPSGRACSAPTRRSSARQAVAADLWLISRACSANSCASARCWPGGGGAQDDVRACGSARPRRIAAGCADGLLADVVVFDPATVRLDATYDEPRHFPAGIKYVIVNGTLVIDGGEHTGALPGRAMRRGRSV